MIKSLNHRAKEAVLKLSNELSSLGDADIKSSYVKLATLLDKHAQEIRDINQEIKKYKDEYK